MSTPENSTPAASPVPPATSPVAARGPSRWRPWFAAGLIFVLGFGAGGLTTVALGLRAVRKRAAQPPPTVAAAANVFADRQVERIARDVERELDLTPAQAARVREELERTATNLKQTRARVLREVQKEFRESVVRIGQSLPPEKRKEFRELVRDRFRRAGLRQAEESETNPSAAPAEPGP